MALFRYFLAIFLLAAVARPDPGQAAVEIQKIVSPGGIEAWLVENHTLPIIAVNAGFHGGSRLDPDGKAGLANLVSGLLDEGAGDLDSQAFQRRLDELSIKLGFDAGRDSFYATLRTLTENRDEAFRLLSLALSAPRFDPEPIQRVRAQVLAVLAEQQEDPQEIAHKAWYAAAFPNYPYGKPVEGTPDSVKAIGREDLVRYAHEYLTRKRLRVVVVGDIDGKTLGPLLDRTFGPMAESGPEPDLAPPSPDRPSGLTVIHRDIPQTVVLLGEKGLLRKDPDFIPAYVMNYILGGGGFASRLMEQVREKRGLAYNVQTELVPLDFAGLLVGGVATVNSHAADSLGLIRSEFKRMREQGVTEKELEDAKTYLTGAFPLRFDSNGKIASELMGIRLQELGIDYVNKRNDLIRAVTLDDIRRVATRLLDPDALLVVAVGDPKGLQDNKSSPVSGSTPEKPESEGAGPAASPADSGTAPATAAPPDASGPAIR